MLPTKYLLELAKEIENGSAEFQELRLKNFADRIKEYANYVGCDGKDKIGSHNIPSHVNFYLTNPETGEDQVLNLYAIELNMLGGCGCPDGITFKLVTTPEII